MSFQNFERNPPTPCDSVEWVFFLFLKYQIPYLFIYLSDELIVCLVDWRLRWIGSSKIINILITNNIILSIFLIKVNNKSFLSICSAKSIKMYFLLWRSSHWLRNELINSVCLVSCIVFKLKGMTINFPSLKAVQGDCIKIQYVQVQLRSCSVLVTINTSLFSHPIFITAPTSRKFTSEKQILLNVCRKREERWAGLCSSFFVSSWQNIQTLQQ